ncbi:MAG: hypothetical protein EA353_11320 [Puniceicoccaceae bacterium]|nr:MAG: hypothetical protein EA353_11320 [Puniceicoccaceae bacterium]
MSESIQQDEVHKVAKLFEQMGASTEQARVMSSQLLKRAEQIAQERNISKVEALQSLLKQVVEARQGS